MVSIEMIILIISVTNKKLSQIQNRVAVILSEKRYCIIVVIEMKTAESVWLRQQIVVSCLNSEIHINNSNCIEVNTAETVWLRQRFDNF